jgi:hypothetical protein
MLKGNLKMQKDNVKCKIIFLSILFLGVFSLAGSSRAATYAINPSCGIDGDGTTWSCGNGAGHAWNSLPPSEKISRGDTIYIGSGTIEHAADTEPPYGYKMNKPLDNPPTWITFKKATVVEHGPSSGWNDAYASGQTIFRSLGPYNTILYTGSSDTGYYQFDGVYGSKSKDESTYGFSFKYYAAIPSPAGVSVLVYGNEQPNITWQQLKFNHVAFLGTPDNRDVAADNAAIRGSGSYTTFVNSLFKNFNNAIEAPSNNLTLDTVIFTDAAVGKSAHNQYISYGEDNLTIKNSDSYATPQSQLMYSTSDQPDSGFITCNWSGGKDVMDNWQLYNNLIVGNAGYGPFVGTADQCAGCNTNAKIYSNTFVDATAQVSFHDLQGSIVQPGGACSGSHLACFSSGNFVTNNLYYH